MKTKNLNISIESPCFELSNTIGNRLKLLRFMYNIDKKTMYNLLNYARKTYDSIESDKKSLSISEQNKIINHFKLTNNFFDLSVKCWFIDFV